MITIREENIPWESKRDSKCPYWYITKHGIGPGTLPKDVKLGKVKDLDNYYTIIWIDRPLSTDELKYYDIYPETMNHKILDRLGISFEELDECNESLKEYYDEDDFDNEDDDFDYEDYEDVLFGVAIDIGVELENKYGYDIECKSVVPYNNYKEAQFNYDVDGEIVSVDVKLNPPYDPSTQFSDFLDIVEDRLRYWF